MRKFEDLVCSLDRSKKLVELGIPVNFNFDGWVVHQPFQYYHWMRKPKKAGEWKLGSPGSIPKSYIAGKEVYPAFTVAELGLLMPFGFDDRKFKQWFWQSYGTSIDGRLSGHCNFYSPELKTDRMDLGEGRVVRCHWEANNEANARADALIWLFEEGHVSMYEGEVSTLFSKHAGKDITEEERRRLADL